MDREDAIDTLVREDPDAVLEFIAGGTPDFGPYEEQVRNAVEVLGEARARQVVGADGQVWVTLYTTTTDDELSARRDDLLNRLESLWDEGKIANYETESVRPKLKVGDMYTPERLVIAFRQYRFWASWRGLTLEPFFQVKQGGDVFIFPDMFLVVRSRGGVRMYSLDSEERDTSALRGVFPCADGEEHFSIENYLTALEKEEPWRPQPDRETPETPDYGAHGNIKGYVFQNPAKTVGEEWERPTDEEWVEGESEEDRGYVDLVFTHKHKEAYLLVEVKPLKSPDEVDRAFGQLGRYRYQFLSEKAHPHLSPTDIHLAIAAPGFIESHRKAANDWDIELIEV